MGLHNFGLRLSSLISANVYSAPNPESKKYTYAVESNRSLVQDYRNCMRTIVMVILSAHAVLFGYGVPR